MPIGLSRADGLDGNLGQASAYNSVLVHGGGSGGANDNIPFNEDANSPTDEKAEQRTIQHSFTGSYEYLKSWHEYSLARGMVYVEMDDFGEENEWMVLSSTLQHAEGNQGRLTVVVEGKSGDVPPDEFDIQPVELGLNIIKYPRYFYAFFGDGIGSATELQNQMVIRLLQDYFENASAPFRNALVQMLIASLDSPTGSGTQPPAWNKDTQTFTAGALISGTRTAKCAALEIIQKYWRGIETPYIVGWEMHYSYYTFVQPFLHPGGIIEDPYEDAAIPVPEYFLSTTWPPNMALGNGIFDYFAVINPQCYTPATNSGKVIGIDWLRKADARQYNRTWFRVTQTWIGTPVGFWDTEIYSKGQRPSLSNGGADYIGTAKSDLTSTNTPVV